MYIYCIELVPIGIRDGLILNDPILSFIIVITYPTQQMWNVNIPIQYIGECYIIYMSVMMCITVYLKLLEKYSECYI